MADGPRRFLWVWTGALAAALAIGLAALSVRRGRPLLPLVTHSTTHWSTATTTPGVAATPAVRTYAQLLHADLPDYPEPRPFDQPVDLADAAHVILREPVYICPRGDLWIARSDAEALPDVLARAAEQTEHICDRPVQYVLWTVQRKGDWQARAVCRQGREYELVGAKQRLAIPWPRSYHWARAISWDDDGTTRLIVPCDDGVSVITIGKELSESYCRLRQTSESTTAPDAGGPVQVLFDLRGILAWIAADNAAGGRVARFVDGAWTVLDAAAWPPDIIHLVPLLDGSVLQIRRGADAQTVQLLIVPLDTPRIDQEQVTALAQQLDDEDPDKRLAAFARLTEYGPWAIPILLKLRPEATPEAQARIDQLLAVTLGGMVVNDNQLTVAARLPDGGAVFLAPHGVSIPQGQRPPQIVLPAYLVLRPGRPVQTLPAAIAHEMDASSSITAVRDEWVITRPERGPARFLPPNQFVPLLRESERKFSHLAGIDARGRWLLRQADAADSPTLILDPTIPDLTPRLAIWTIDTGSDVGWEQAGWPVIARGKDFWLLTDHGWELMQPPDRMQTQLSSAPTTGPAANGSATLTVVGGDGRRQAWKLPPPCVGSVDFPPWVIRSGDGHLFLFNSPDKIVRLRPTTGPQPPGQAPFVVEAIFSKDLPAWQSIRRVWLDPAGRIAVAYDQSHLAIIFPSGQVPGEIADQILPKNVRRIEGR